MAMKGGKNGKKESEKKITASTRTLWREGNHLLDISLLPDKAAFSTRRLSCLVQSLQLLFFCAFCAFSRLFLLPCWRGCSSLVFAEERFFDPEVAGHELGDTGF